VRRLDQTAVLTALLSVVFALAFPVQKAGLRGVDALWFAAGRATVAAVVLAPFLRPSFRFTVREHLLAAALGLSNISAFIGFQVAGLKLIGAGPAAALVFTQPVLVLMLARVVLRTRLTRRRVLGALVGLAGVTVVATREFVVGSPVGVLLLLLAALAWAAGTVLLKLAASKPLLPLLALQTLYGAVPLIAIALVAAPVPLLSTRLALSLLYVGAAVTSGGWIVFALLVRRGDAGSVSSRLYFVPVLGALFSTLFLSEPLRPTLVIGAVIVGAGVRLVTRAEPSRTLG
jgi:drug/metabolite transporter (DMT)-like permease